MKNSKLPYIFAFCFQSCGLLVADSANATINDAPLYLEQAAVLEGGNSGNDSEVTEKPNFNQLSNEAQAEAHQISVTADTPSIPDNPSVQSPSNFQFRPRLQLQTSQQQVNQSGSLFSNTHDNARTANLTGPSERYNFQMFGYQTQPSINYNGLTVDYVPASYNSGASLQLADWNQWKLHSAYFASNTAQPIETTSGAPETGTWDISADRQWLERSILTRMEYAQSQTSNPKSNSTYDRAMDAQIDIASPDWISLPLLDNWTAGAHYRAIGKEYYSTGGIYLPNGLEESNVFFQPSIRNFVLNVGWRKAEQEHVDAWALLPKTETRSMLSLTYSPQLNDGNRLQKVFGKPSIVTHYHKADQIEPDFGGITAIQPMLSKIDEQGIALQLSQELVNWSIQFQKSDQYRRHVAKKGAGTPAPNWRKDSTLLKFGLTPLQDFYVNVNAQWNRLYESGNSIGDSQQLYNVEARYDIARNFFSISMQHNHEDSLIDLYNGSAAKTDATNKMSTAEVSWRAITFKGSRPAVDLFFRSGYGKFNDYVVASTNEQWSAQLSMKLYWGADQL
jgi:hypothetical protein